MKKITYLLLFSVIVLACKNKQEEASVDDITTFNEKAPAEDTVQYPENLARIMEVHGGMDQWNKMNELRFELNKESGREVHQVSLKDRRTRIDGPDWTIGSDGQDVWLEQAVDSAYGGNARFYHNLYFYFYAMPFVLGDEGIVYEDVEPKELDGVSYPGVRISYELGIGDSDKDEYVLYYDPETYVMKWLAYTVTFKTNESSDNWRYIKYSKWSPINGLTLPETLTWYQVEDDQPTEPRNELLFEKVAVSEAQLGDDLFSRPSSAEIIQR
ncbi:DUF6503 family protein [Aureitalea marina]|uniref:Threonine synthase n=1 Tax=Aureitalea marina TaxID=930804 RepID=A0A2S7KQ27_9FLAO|nr:DUF6503 family protein [Aureitalea marina]PQB04707.1 hypothetical protein BST85_07225 [Aureitalea marina]